MRREIKFRAWDSVMNEMFYDSELSNGDLLVIHMDGRLELSDDDTYKVSDFNILQFTGLRDENGKEIYEGDIVKVAGFSPRNYLVIWDEDYGSWILREDVSLMEERIRYEHFKNSQVVGNIYENPNMFKKEE